MESEEDKPFKCMVCENAYTSKSRLVSHMKIHTKETGIEYQINLKPFKCDYCLHYFIRFGYAHENSYW